MKIAIEGCAHGCLEEIYKSIESIERAEGFKIDLLICCGDFQSVRNEDDLSCMAVPPKYREMGTFYRYYSGEKVAPVLTIFIGGNHEASNYLQELPYGGWVAPKIYYLGYAGVVNFRGLRIGGLSGIYKGPDYLKGHFELPPYNDSTRRSVYHVRNVDVFRLKQLKGLVNVFISHDWPRGVCNYGDIGELLYTKPHFREDVENNQLGSRPSQELLEKLQPDYWFAAHLHVKFSAIVPHTTPLDGSDEKRTTKFLALDKCLPRRKFLQVLDMPENVEASQDLCYDAEWLSILISSNHLTSTSSMFQYMPGPRSTEGRWDFSPTHEEIELVYKLFHGEMKIPNNFTVTVPPYNPYQRKKGWAVARVNSQTTILCEILHIDDPTDLLMHGKSPRLPSVAANDTSLMNDSEIDITQFERSTDMTQVSINLNLSESEADISSVYGSCNSSLNDSPCRPISSTPRGGITRSVLNLPAVKTPLGQPCASLNDSPIHPLASTPRGVSNRTVLNLAAPQTPLASQPKLSFLEMADFSPVARLEENTSEKRPSDDDETPTVSRGPKMFKRRNQSLYTSTEEENE